MLRGLFEEVFAVGRSIGVPLTDDLYVRRWRSFFEGPEHLRPSLAIDIEERRPHELKWLTGTVCALAERSKTAAPLHRRAFKTLARTDERPMPAHAAA
jgi:ketopantoate reductase